MIKFPFKVYFEGFIFNCALRISDYSSVGSIPSLVVEPSKHFGRMYSLILNLTTFLHYSRVRFKGLRHIIVLVLAFPGWHGRKSEARTVLRLPQEPTVKHGKLLIHFVIGHQANSFHWRINKFHHEEFGSGIGWVKLWFFDLSVPLFKDGNEKLSFLPLGQEVLLLYFHQIEFWPCGSFEKPHDIVLSQRGIRFWLKLKILNGRLLWFYFQLRHNSLVSKNRNTKKYNSAIINKYWLQNGTGESTLDWPRTGPETKRRQRQR